MPERTPETPPQEITWRSKPDTNAAPDTPIRRAYVRIYRHSTEAWHCTIVLNDAGEIESAEIVTNGDADTSAIKDALSLVAKTLNEQREIGG